MNKAPVCVVAGVGPGIGFAVAKRFARGGFHVGLLARNAAVLSDFVDELKREGCSGTAWPVDLLDEGAVRSTFQQVQDEAGPVEVLVYNAARWNRRPAMDFSAEAFAEDLSLCVIGALVCCQAVYPHMKNSRAGTILLTGGGLALRPEYGAGVASLTAGKSALRGFAYALARELAPEGIHVATVTVTGAVAPGTPFDPDRIAERYWSLYGQNQDIWQTEIVFSGAE